MPGLSGLGQSGGGKTSALMNLAIPLLLLGCGFLWLCAKPDEAALVWRLVKATRRERQFVLFGQDIDRDTGEPLVDTRGQPVMTGHRFNALDYESQRRGASMTLSMVKYLSEMAASLERSQRERGGGEEPFWRKQFELLTGYCIDVALLAGLVVSVELLREIQKFAPRDRDQLASEEWQEQSVFTQCLRRIEHRVNAGEASEYDLQRCLDYFLSDALQLDGKVRGTIDVMFAALADIYARDPVRTLLTTTTTFTPEDIFNGAIVCANLPTRTYFEPGHLAQSHVKFSYQRSVLQRVNPVIPTVMWLDENHNWCSPFDATDFFPESRSFKSWMRDDDQKRLWERFGNEIEKAEDGHNRRASALLAKDFQIAAPRELTDEQNWKLGTAFAERLKARGLAAAIAMHDQDAADGGRNPHFHVMVSMRTVDENGFSKRKWRGLDGGRGGGGGELMALRREYYGLVNDALREADIKGVYYDPEKQDKQPGEHVGKGKPRG